MATLSAKERAILPRPHGRDAVWAALRAADAPLTVADIWDRINAGQLYRGTAKDTIRDYLDALASAGIVEKLDRRPIAFRLLNDPGPVTPRVRRDGVVLEDAPHGRQRLWQAMRALKEFDRIELAMTAGVSEESAAEYAQILCDAGYLQISRATMRHAREARKRRWRFIASRNTGPRAPQITKLRAVWDPNLGETVYARHLRGRPA